MATYIALMNWTDQGIKSVKESPKRLDAARDLAKKLGCELRTLHDPWRLRHGFRARSPQR
jgi:uncharacterized protein with GYD domain